MEESSDAQVCMTAQTHQDLLEIDISPDGVGFQPRLGRVQEASVKPFEPPCDRRSMDPIDRRQGLRSQVKKEPLPQEVPFSRAQISKGPTECSLNTVAFLGPNPGQLRVVALGKPLHSFLAHELARHTSCGAAGSVDHRPDSDRPDPASKGAAPGICCDFGGSLPFWHEESFSDSLTMLIHGHRGSSEALSRTLDVGRESTFEGGKRPLVTSGTA